MNDDHRFTVPILKSAIVAVLLSAPFSGAFAQSSTGDSALVLEEIIVTARKREESLQDAPVVISALSSKTIADFAIKTVEDISDFTPGLIADSQGNAAGGVLFLRGVGSGSGSPAIDQAVSLVIDDMQVGTLQIQNSAMIDMDTVQVYKGPQALFFGKNSPGGVLSIRTADPGDEFEAQLMTGYEFEGEEWFVQGIVSGPISDTAAGRLVVRYTETTDGLWDVQTGSFPNSFGDRAIEGESMFARGTLVLTPSDDLTIRTKLTYNDRDDVADGRIAIQRIHCPHGDPLDSEPFECKANGKIQTSDIPQGALDILAGLGWDMDARGVGENEQLLTTVAIDYEINDELRFSSNTGYYKVSSLQNSPTNFSLSAPVASSVQDLEVEQFTQEFRLASEFSGPVNFLTGVYYEKKEHDSNITVPVDAVLFGSPVSFWVLGGVTDFEQDAEALSAFVDLTWDITDQLELSTGARYSDEEKEFEGTRGYVGAEKQDWDDFSPQVTLSYSVNDDWMLYVSYKEGFKSGGFDGAFQFVSRPLVSYEPETVEGFEAGAKGTLLDNTLQLNVAVYSYDYDDLQLSRWDPETISLSVVNAAAAEITGVDLDFVWVTPVEGLQARGAISYLDAEFTDYRAPCYTGQTPAAGCNLDFNAAAGAFNSQDVSGEPLVLAAEYVANLGLSYEKALTNVVLGLTLDALYSDDYPSGSTRPPGTTQDSYTKVNASIRLSSIDDTWFVSLIGRNLTDEFTYTFGGVAPFTGSGTGTAAGVLGDSIGYVRPGRTVALEFGYNF